MNKFKEVLDRYDLKINSYKYIKKARIVDTNKGILVYKENANNYDIYEYLKTRGFNFFPKTLNVKNERFDLYEYIESTDIPYEQKLNDLIQMSAILHNKTSFLKEMDIDEIKKIYEDINIKIIELLDYYNQLNLYIDSIIFMSPVEYLLVSNIDLFYYLISFVKIEIKNWYLKIKEKKMVRYSMIHNNLSLEHLIVNQNKYLISWDLARQDMPILDLIKIFQDNYYEIELDNLINEYIKYDKLDELEYLFLLINLAIPKKIEFTKNTYLDCENLNKYIVYLRKIASLIQKMDKSKLKT